VYHIAKREAPSMVGVGYRARIVDGGRLAPGKEMLELQVFALDDLPELAFPSHRQILGDFVRSQASREEVKPQRAGAAALRASRPSPGRARSPQRRRR